MFIKYTGTNVLALPHVTKIATGDKKLMQSPSDVKWFRPGWNNFPKAVWDQNADHPQIRKLIKKGVLVLFCEKAKVKVLNKKTGRTKFVTKEVGMDDKPIKLRYFDEKLALKIVKETWDRDLLQMWDDDERRHKVKRALRKQIEPLLASKEDDADEDDFDDEDGEGW